MYGVRLEVRGQLAELFSLSTMQVPGDETQVTEPASKHLSRLNILFGPLDAVLRVQKIISISI